MELNKFFSTREDTGPGIGEDFAKIINNGIRCYPNEVALDSLLTKYKRRQNCANLVVPKVNTLFWEKLSNNTRYKDALVKKVQTVMLKSLVPIITLSDILHGTPQGNNLSQDGILRFANDNIRLASSAFVLLCHARKELVKGDLHADYFKLCSKNIPISRDWLFGDDVGKQVKELGQDKLKFKFTGHRHPGRKQFNTPTTYYSSKQDKGILVQATEVLA